MNSSPDIIIKSFVADSAIEAIEKIREELGPDAVVLDVRQHKRQGLSGFIPGLGKPKIEILACKATEVRPKISEFEELRNAIATLKAELKSIQQLKQNLPQNLIKEEDELSQVKSTNLATFLENYGLLPVFARRIADDFPELSSTPITGDELESVLNKLKKHWKYPSYISFENQTLDFYLPPGTHLYVGAPGCGKTTVLCKCLIKTTLIEGVNSARVIQLDGTVTNTTEVPSLYCEILGVEFLRVADSINPNTVNYQFIDIPGIDWKNKSAIAFISSIINRLKVDYVHLVLNSCYDTNLMIAQAREFSALNISDIILTHLDEENRRGRIWNLVLGTNFAIGYISSGQNIPGILEIARPQMLF